MASQIIGAIAGVVVGYFTSNPQLGFATYAAVAGVASYLDQPDRQGPRLEDLRTQISSYGNPIPFEWGTNRHAGTVIWPAILEAVEHEHTESAKGGPDSTTFTYTMSFGILVCEGPIAGIRRIWANKKLVYDVSVGNTGATQDPAFGDLRIYLGTETQDPDPLMEAVDGTSPAYLGYAYVVFENYDVTELNGRVPQFEFEVITAGIDDVPPPTTFGESIDLGGGGFTMSMDESGIWVATVTGHASFNETTGEYELIPGDGLPQIQQYDPLTHELLWAYTFDAGVESLAGWSILSGGQFFVASGGPGVDGANFTLGWAVDTESKGVIPFTMECTNNGFDDAFYWPTTPIPLLENNQIFFAGGNGAAGGFAPAWIPASVISEGGQTDYAVDFSGDTPLWNAPAGFAQSLGYGGVCPPTPPVSYPGVSFDLPDWTYKSTVISNPHGIIAQGYGDSTHSSITWVGHTPRVTSSNFATASNQPPSIHGSNLLPGGPTAMPPIAWDEDNQTVWAFAAVTSGSPGDDHYRSLYACTLALGSLIVTETGFQFPVGGDSTNSEMVRAVCMDERTGYLRVLRGGGFGEHAYLDLIDPVGETVIDHMDIGTGYANAFGQMWDVPEENKVIFSEGFNLHDIPYGSQLDPDRVLLSDIVSDICVRTGLETSDIDVTDLTDEVDGYIVARQMTARSAIEPLQAAYYFDAVESDNKIKFVKRGVDETVTTVPQDDRAAHEAGQAMPDALSIRRAFELELPYQADVDYVDIDADHQIGNQYDRRITKDTRQRVTLSLPIVMPATKAKEVARTVLYDAWQNQTFQWATTRKYAYLEPTDVVSLPTPSATYRAVITNRRDQPNGIIEWEGRIQALETFDQSGADGITPPYNQQTVFEATTTILELLDIPILRDEDNDAGYYVAMGAQI